MIRAYSLATKPSRHVVSMDTNLLVNDGTHERGPKYFFGNLKRATLRLQNCQILIGSLLYPAKHVIISEKIYLFDSFDSSKKG